MRPLAQQIDCIRTDRDAVGRRELRGVGGPEVGGDTTTGQDGTGGGDAIADGSGDSAAEDAGDAGVDAPFDGMPYVALASGDVRVYYAKTNGEVAFRIMRGMARSACFSAL